jgi:hypothetical protein
MTFIHPLIEAKLSGLFFAALQDSQIQEKLKGQGFITADYAVHAQAV